MERTIHISEEQYELIEKFGVSVQRGGATPAEARIIALLVVCDVTELTFDEIYQALKISKSAASNAINRLLSMNKIDYKTKPGDRKRYFHSKLGQWENSFKEGFEQMFKVSGLLQEVLKQRSKSDKDFNNSLRELIDFITFMQKELPIVYKKWKEKKK